MLNYLCRMLIKKRHDKPYNDDINSCYIVIKQIITLTCRIFSGIYKLSFISYVIINQRR